MRLYNFAVTGTEDGQHRLINRWIDMDHIQEMSALSFDIKPSIEVTDRDGIKSMSSPLGFAKFWIRLAFQDKVIGFEIQHLSRLPAHYTGESRAALSERVVREINEFMSAYDKFFHAWSSTDGAQPAFTLVQD